MIKLRIKNAAGFTLVEMITVMAIIAIISVLGIAALSALNSNNVVDRAAQELTSAIREAQNKSISVANEPGGSVPVAWGVYVDPSAKYAQPFYIGADLMYHIVPMAKLDYTSLKSVTVTGVTHYFFTTPFGKFYSMDSSNFGSIQWLPNDQRPYDILPTGITASNAATTIEFAYRNSTRKVIIETNGDVHAQ